jgi:hypothetical protein
MKPHIICHMLSSVDGRIDGEALETVTAEGPESLYQPLVERSRVDRELTCALDRELVHERLGGLGSTEKTSKKSFSSICSRSW